MPQLVSKVLLVVILVGVAAGCSSPPAATPEATAPPAPASQRYEEVCRDVAVRVSGLATVEASAPLPQLLPVVDAQLAAAKDGQVALAGITPTPAEQPKHDALLAAWGQAVSKMEAFRVTRASTPDTSGSGPAADELAAARARLAAADVRVAETAAVSAVADLAQVALRSDAAPCQAIPWPVLRPGV